MRFLMVVVVVLIAAGIGFPLGLYVFQAAEAEVHLKKACEAVWTDKKEYQINQCVKRAMASLTIQNRLRDNELKRLLTASERELAACKEQLEKINEPVANFIPWRGRTHQPPRR